MARALMRKGWSISVPWGENSKYDLVVDDGKSLLRIQCKTGRVRKGVLLFNTYTSHVHRDGKQEGYKGKADYFGVFCSENDKCYLVPVADVPEATTGSLRLTPTKNKQEKGIKYAVAYEI